MTQAERDQFIAALQALDSTKIFPDGVSYWDKQDQIHQVTHVHGGPAFLPWHRELCNRLEQMLQEVDPGVALHYWDWTTDPTNAPDGNGGTVDLFTAQNMGNSHGRAGVPFDTFDNGGTFAGSRDDTGDPADPPEEITRDVDEGAPTDVDSDNDLIHCADGLVQNQQWERFHNVLEGWLKADGSPAPGGGDWNHNYIHGYIGGTIGAPHSSFEDPFVFLLHSNVDRLWAMWQTEPGHEWRLDPAQVYGTESGDPDLTSDMEPWAGGTGTRPWAPPENQTVHKNSLHPSVVAPPCYDTLPVSVDLQSPVSGAAIEFNAVPEGVTTVRAAVFDVRACGDVNLEITAGPGAGFGTPLGATTVVPYVDGYVREGRVWISFTGTTAGSIANGQVTIHCNETGDDWTIDIVATTVAKPKVASMLVLDKSGSMDWDSGIPGLRRLDVLRWAAPNYVQLMDDDDGIGLVAFDHDAYPVMGVTAAGPPVFGAGRTAALSAIASHDEDGGATSIGDGVELAHNTITPVPGYDQKALVVLTDGHENSPKYLADVSLNERLFAIGLGRADQLDLTKLDAITSGSGGFMLMTGDLTVDDLFRLSKYFLQVLAGVTNTEIVVDPDAVIGAGQKHRIPFALTEGDYRADVIVLSPAAWALELALETPDGQEITAADAGAAPQMTFAAGAGVAFYRFGLPLLLDSRRHHEGAWHALVRLADRQLREVVATHVATDTPGFGHSLPYSLSVHARSNVAMHPSVIQSGHEPGASVQLRAVLSQYDLPIMSRATVRVDIARPDATSTVIALAHTEQGRYEGGFVAEVAGVYQLRFLAQGFTLAGQPFTREGLRTAAVSPGADRVVPRPGDGGWERLCELVTCLLRSDGLRRALEKRGIDVSHLERCFHRLCEPAGENGGKVRVKAVAEIAAILDMPEVRALLSERLRDQE